MARTTEEHAFDVLREHLENNRDRKKAVSEGSKIIEEGRLLALSEMIYRVEGSAHGKEKKREVYTVTRGVGTGTASCSCRAKEFSRESCKHWLAVVAYASGIRRRKEELEEERRELLRRADELLEEASDLNLM